MLNNTLKVIQRLQDAEVEARQDNITLHPCSIPPHIYQVAAREAYKKSKIWLGDFVAEF